MGYTKRIEEQKLKVDIYSSHRNVTKSDIKNKTAIVIDVLRSSSTLIAAFNNGLKRFLVVDSPIDAPRFKETLNNDRVLMGGTENHGFITGFDVGDLLDDYRPTVVRGKELIYYNADFSPALKKAHMAQHVLLGGLINQRAVAKKLISLNTDVAIMCAGTNGNFSIEDGLAAGGLVKELQTQGVEPQLSEYAYVLQRMYSTYKNNLLSAVKHSRTYQSLVHVGLEHDVLHALLPNQYDFAPELYDNWITVKR